MNPTTEPLCDRATAIWVTCTGCRGEIGITTEHDDSTVVCPNCQTAIENPTTSAQQRRMLAEEAERQRQSDRFDSEQSRDEQRQRHEVERIHADTANAAEWRKTWAFLAPRLTTVGAVLTCLCIAITFAYRAYDAHSDKLVSIAKSKHEAAKYALAEQEAEEHTAESRRNEASLKHDTAEELLLARESDISRLKREVDLETAKSLYVDQQTKRIAAEKALLQSIKGSVLITYAMADAATATPFQEQRINSSVRFRLERAKLIAKLVQRVDKDYKNRLNMLVDSRLPPKEFLARSEMLDELQSRALSAIRKGSLESLRRLDD